MKNQIIIASLAGLVIGFFFWETLSKNNPWKLAYEKGLNFSAPKI